ncbi:MAG: twin-arginine translocase TatA/TatE family subunit [bacterium]
MPFGIGMAELLVILVIVLIIFGAGKLPEIGHGLGKAIRNFKDATSSGAEKEAREKITDATKKEIEEKSTSEK